MKPQTCRYCLQPASGTVTATGGGKPRVVVPHCDQHWEDAYQQVKAYPARTWKMLDTQPTLF